MGRHDEEFLSDIRATDLDVRGDELEEFTRLATFGLGEPERTTITVTEEDITYGLKTNCDHCPIALAAKRAFQAAPGRLWVGATTIRLVHSSGQETHSILLPQDAQYWQACFDGGLKVAPITFDVLTPPAEVLEQVKQ